MPAYPRPTQFLQQLFERAEDFFLQSYPMREYPLRLRPVIVVAVACWVLLLGVLGLAPIPALPINDKALHFFGMGFAAFLVYFVLDVPEGPHRRVWYIRRAPLLLTLVTAFFIGGIVSEFVQALLPWKHFEALDIVFNLLGGTLFVYIAHLLSQRARRRSELAELYQPLTATDGAVYRDAQGRTHAFAPAAAGAAAAGGIALELEDAEEGRGRSDVWDAELDDFDPTPGPAVFSLGEDLEEHQ